LKNALEFRRTARREYRGHYYGRRRNATSYHVTRSSIFDQWEVEKTGIFNWLEIPDELTKPGQSATGRQ